MQGVNGKDEASLVAQLQQENRKLRSDLEEQYKQAIKLADTIQMVHLARIKEAAKDMHPKISPTSPPEDFKKDLDGTSSGMEGQQQDILSSKQPFAAQAEQLRTLEDRARKWAKKYLHKIKAAASKAEAAAGIPSPAPASGAGAMTASPAGSQSVLEQRPPNARTQSSSVTAAAQLSERTPTKPIRNGESSDIRRPVARQPVAGRPVSRSVSRTPESTRGASRSRLMDPIGTRITGRASDPPRRSASRPAESSARLSINSAAEGSRRSLSRPAESTGRTVRTTDSVRRSISRPVEGTMRSQSRPIESRPTRSVNRTTAESVRRSVSSRPAESTRSVSTARSAARAGSSTATSSWRPTMSERSPAAEVLARRAQLDSDADTVPSPPASRRTPPGPDPQPCQPDLQSAERLPEASTREAQQREAQQQREAEQQREAQQREAEQREAEQREAQQREAQRREAEQREAEQREAQHREAQRREAQQSEAQRREAQQRESAAMRSPQPTESPERPYRNGSTPPAAAPTPHAVPDLSATNGALRGVAPTSPSTPPHVASPAKVTAGMPAADGVAEALQGSSQMDSAALIDSVVEKRLGGGNSSMQDGHQPSSLVTNIRTNQMFQSIDVHDSVAEELLSATYASDTASMMSTMTGQEKVWTGGIPAPKKKKGTRTTFLNRLFSSKKASG